MSNYRVTVVLFSGHCDHIHNIDIFSDLYVALRHSCRYYHFNDADELLFLTNESRFVKSKDEAHSMLNSVNVDVIFCPWLEVQREENHVFSISDGPNLFRWGKPVISSNLKPVGFINHNIQFAQSNRLGSFRTGWFVGHFRWASPDERIRANIEKLLSFGLYGSADEIMLACNEAAIYEAARDGAKKYLDEIKRAELAKNQSSAVHLNNRSIILNDDGILTFVSNEGEQIFRTMSDINSLLCSQVLGLT